MYLQDSFWNKINNNLATFKDLESYIYNKEYIDAVYSRNMDTLLDYSDSPYNSKLFNYYFEFDKINYLGKHKEIYFQMYLDGDLTLNEYLTYENRFILFLRYLNSISRCFIYCDFFSKLDNNYPFLESKDVCFNKSDLISFSEKLSEINSINIYEQFCIIATREIGRVIFVFPQVQVVLIASGLHGTILSVNPIILQGMFSVLTLKKTGDKLLEKHIDRGNKCGGSPSREEKQ